MNIDDMTKALVIIQMIREVPPFLREMMLHDLIKTLGYKLTEPQLKELRDWLNPPPMTWSSTGTISNTLVWPPQNPLTEKTEDKTE